MANFNTSTHHTWLNFLAIECIRPETKSPYTAQTYTWIGCDSKLSWLHSHGVIIIAASQQEEGLIPSWDFSVWGLRVIFAHAWMLSKSLWPPPTVK